MEAVKRPVVVRNALGQRVFVAPYRQTQSEWTVKDFTGECRGCVFFLPEIPAELKDNGDSSIRPPAEAVGICAFGYNGSRRLNLHKYLVPNLKHHRDICPINPQSRAENLERKKKSGTFYFK